LSWSSFIIAGESSDPLILQARWVVDGNIWTTSGVVAGMDGIFAWIAMLWGEDQASRIANIIEYERQMDPSIDPFAAVWNVTQPATPSPSAPSAEPPAATPTQCKAKPAARRRRL